MGRWTPGKRRRLARLGDREGRFRLVAVDQRGWLRRGLARALGIDPQRVRGEDLTGAQVLIVSALAPYATGVLLDPEYGYPQALPALPGDVGLLLALEATGYEEAGDGEPRTRLLEGWDPERLLHAGADAVKLLLSYHPDASPETRAHQEGLVRRVGEGCREADIPFLLAVVNYPLKEEGPTDGPAYARRRPDLALRTVAELSRPEYGVDVLAVEFPADLRYVREYSRGTFDGVEREPLYTLDEVRHLLREMDRAARVPWVLLGAGVGMDRFLAQLELAVEGGASGFLCGPALWHEALPLFPDREAMARALRTQAVYDLLRANAVAGLARPWWAHPRPEGAG